MSVSSVTNPTSYDLGALQTASVNQLVSKLNTTFGTVQAQASDASVKLSGIGQVQSGFATIQSKAATLQDTANLGTAADAQTALQDVFGALNSQVSLVGNLTEPGALLSGEKGVADSAVAVRSLVSSTSLLGQTALQSLGVKSGSDGSLSIDAATFNAAYAANPSQVTQVLAGIGASINGAAGEQIASGSAVYTSQTKAQTQYASLSQKQEALYERISSLQSGGATASTLQDFNALNTVVSSAATRLSSLQTTYDKTVSQINSYGQKQSDLNQVSNGVADIQQKAQAVADAGSNPASDAASAGLALQGLFDSLNTQTNLLNTLGAAKTTTTAAGSLNSESALRTSLGQMSNYVSSTLLNQLGLGNIGVSQSNGLFTLDQSTFSSAFSSNKASVTSFLSNVGSLIKQSADNQFLTGSSLDKVQRSTDAKIIDLQAQIFSTQARIDSVQADPFSAVALSSYQKILTM